jgi:putative flavoprotein involved in K+ transport
VTTVIIGAGQSGLAMSKHLSDRGIDHVVLERGEVANSWRTERWDSLRLLTPNWQSRLPGFAYSGPDPDGYMTMPETIAYLKAFADHSRAPVQTHTTVTASAGWVAAT